MPWLPENKATRDIGNLHATYDPADFDAAVENMMATNYWRQHFAIRAAEAIASVEALDRKLRQNPKNQVEEAEKTPTQ